MSHLQKKLSGRENVELVVSAVVLRLGQDRVLVGKRGGEKRNTSQVEVGCRLLMLFLVLWEVLKWCVQFC